MPYNDPDSNPYDVTQPDYRPETRSLDEIMHMAGRAWAHELRVCTPATVTAINGEQSVDLQPLLQTRALDGTVASLPVIRHALVLMPIGQDWRIKQPLAVGDTGLAIFCDRSLDAWSVSQGGTVDPEDDRAHDLTDCFYLPGLVPEPKQTKDGTTDLVLGNGSATLRIQKAGTFTLGNGQNELLSLVGQTVQAQSDLLTALSAAFAIAPPGTAGGPAPLDPATVAKVGQLQLTVQMLSQKLATLKGS